MRERKQAIALIIFFVVILSSLFLFSDYRFTPLAAAKAHSDVGKNQTLLGDVDLGWGKGYIFDTDIGLRTVTSTKSSFLWRAPVSVRIEKSEDVIKTVGWMSYTTKEGKQVTVLAVEANDPQVAYIEAGPADNRVRKEITKDGPTIFSWNKAIQANNGLNALALSADGSTLYEYRYPKNTNIFRAEDFRWYKTSGE